jgi:alkylation response protein AidB-like acyl-CoA dehydrogenase
MPLALTDDHRDLADSVAAWARRAAPIEATRAQLDDLAAGKRPEAWDALVRQGLHAVHLPEDDGGAGAGLMELAVVAEQLGRALHPGPFLSTVLASAVVAAAPPSPARGALLERFAEGATGALSDGDGIVATPDGDGWLLHGSSRPVLGLPGADLVVVRASAASGEPVWCVLTPAAGEVVGEPATDLSRSVGRLILDGRAVTAAEVLPAPAPEQVELIAAALLGADAAGVARWFVDAVVGHVSTREQFGVPVGSFQAVQHKAALLLVKAEMIGAAAWDAARAATDAPDQQRLAAAQVGLTALPAAVDVAAEGVLLFGGIGFTWEHDAHLYWRRALSLSAAFGEETAWAARLGAAALDTERDFDFVADDALPELRAELATVLDAALELPEDGVPASGWAPSRGGRRQEHLAAARLVAPHYPEPWGRAAGPQEQAVIAQEFTRRALAQPSTVIGEWVLPTLLLHGTPAQQQRFVDPTLRGEVFWCQLFSEPGAGSDLAGLSTRARKVDGGWCSTARRSGTPWRPRPTGASAWPGPTRMPPSTRGSRTSSSTCAARASTCGRCARRPDSRSSTRSSSTTSSCPTTASSPSPARDGGSRSPRSPTSGSAWAPGSATAPATWSARSSRPARTRRRRTPSSRCSGAASGARWRSPRSTCARSSPASTVSISAPRSACRRSAMPSPSATTPATCSASSAATRWSPYPRPASTPPIPSSTTSACRPCSSAAEPSRSS